MKVTIYSTEQLKEITDRYAAKHLSEKIKIGDLVEFSGISKTTWYKNEEVKAYIKQLNSGFIRTAEDDKIEDMNPSELYYTTKGDPEKIIAIIAKLQTSITILSEEAKKPKKIVKKMDETEFTDKLLEKDRIIANLNKKINEITYRDHKLMTMDDDTMESLNSRTFSQQFGALFED